MRGEPFEALIDAHHGEIYRYLRRVTGRRDIADDLSQETFLRAFRSYRSLAPNSNARAWLFVIATHVTRNYARGERRRDRAKAALLANPPAHADRDERRRVDIREQVEHALLSLPRQQRLALTLRTFHDFDYGEIALTLRCSRDCARAHVFQAPKKVRHRLNGAALGSKP